jgi:hypothetical protein
LQNRIRNAFQNVTVFTVDVPILKRNATSSKLIAEILVEKNSTMIAFLSCVGKSSGSAKECFKMLIKAVLSIPFHAGN